MDVYNQAMKRLPGLMEKTNSPRVIKLPQGFAGLFSLDYSSPLMRRNYEDPVLISCTDGVGTKLKVATMMDKHDTVGIDLVAMSVNDAICCGAEPLFFLDYIAMDKDNPPLLEQIVSGITDGCVQANSALLGGETAIMPDLYAPGEYDLAGFCVGVASRKNIIDGKKIAKGDVAIGIASSGLHSNGFSLVRKIVFERKNMNGNEYIDELGKTIGEELLTPTRLYPKACLPLIEKFNLHGMVHITGGGFWENIPRALPDNLGVEINGNSWEIPPIFNLLQSWGNVDWYEMFRTFNCGIGMVLIVAADEVDSICKHLNDNDEVFYKIGRVVRSEHNVKIKGGVFDDYDLQSIIDAISDGKLTAEIAVVLTDKPDVMALKRAQKAGIKNLCIERTKFNSKSDFETALLSELKAAKVDLVILAGFMRILSPLFVHEYRERIMNIHPSLLPSFPGAHAHRDVLAYGVKISGCTVHFVDEGTDSGPIIMQAAVEVKDDDTEETLAARVLEQEHIIYPKAIQLYVEGKLKIVGRKTFIDNF